MKVVFLWEGCSASATTIIFWINIRSAKTLGKSAVILYMKLGFFYYFTASNSIRTWSCYNSATARLILEQSGTDWSRNYFFYLFSDASIWNMSEDRYLQLVLHTRKQEMQTFHKRKKIYHRRTGCFQEETAVIVSQEGKKTCFKVHPERCVNLN